jgi:hypothetical protein
MISVMSSFGKRWRVWAFLALAAFYFAIPNARPDFTNFNCHDSESYVALSYSMVHGYGYTRSMIPGLYLAHKWWPPGLPLLLAPAVYAGGETVSWLAVKWTIAAIGLIGVLAAWHLVRRLTGSLLTADVAAALVGLNPFYWDFSHQALAEVPITAWLLGGLYVVDRVWANRRVRPLPAGMAGVFCGAGMLIKGYALDLLLAPLAYVFGPRKADLSRRGWLTAGAFFFFGFALPTVFWTVRGADLRAEGFDGHSQMKGLRQKSPMDPESEYLTARETLQVVIHNAGGFAIYHIPAQVLPFSWGDYGRPGPSFSTWKGSGWALLGLTALLLLACWPRSINTVGLHLTALNVAALNLIFIDGWGARYWVVFSCLLLVILSLRLGPALEAARSSVRRAALAALGLALVVNLVWYVAEHEKQPYRDREWEALAELFETASRTEIATQGVRTPNPHAFQLMTGYPAPMPLPSLAPQYDHLVARLDGRGLQPPAGSRIILEAYPWALYRLSRPLALDELLEPKR